MQDDTKKPLDPMATPVVDPNAGAQVPPSDTSMPAAAPTDVPAADATATPPTTTEAPMGAPVAMGGEEPKVDPGTGSPTGTV